MTTFYEKPDSQYTPYQWMDDANCTLYPLGEWDALSTAEKAVECDECPVKQLCLPYRGRNPHVRSRLNIGDVCANGHLIVTKEDLSMDRDKVICRKCKQETRRRWLKQQGKQRATPEPAPTYKGRLIIGGTCKKGLHVIRSEDDWYESQNGKYVSKVCRQCQLEYAKERAAKLRALSLEDPTARRPMMQRKRLQVGDTCRKGHVIATDKDLYVRANGTTRCIQCRREYARKRREEQKAEALARHDQEMRKTA